MEKIDKTWNEFFKKLQNEDFCLKLNDFLNKEYRDYTCYPPRELLFNAFRLTPLDKVKVVIVGQDPYHEPGQAHGLCFSVPDGITPPPSLVNIYKEIQDDLGRPSATNGDLTSWAEQGVLLLNSTLTVMAHLAASHAGRGWEQFTDAVIRAIATQKSGVVYMLWGSYAQKKAEFVDADKNLVLKSVHPSPLSAYRGFFGCKHFSKANEYLVAHGSEPINW